MKKILAIVVISLIFIQSSFSEIKLIERDFINQGKNRYLDISTICVNGHIFVTAYDKAIEDTDKASGSVAITQMFTRSAEKNSFPARCD